MAGGMHQFPDQTSSDHHGRRPQLLGPMPRIVADRADVPMHAGAEPVTTPRRLESAALVPKARQFRKNPTWKSELTVKINADSGSNIEVFYRAGQRTFTLHWSVKVRCPFSRRFSRRQVSAARHGDL